MKDLHSFVDLSLANVTSETGSYTEILANLQSVGTVFAPLLFTINKSAGFGEFMQHCKIVFEHLRTNENIVNKLVS